MSLEHIKTEREERIVTLYQVDPCFYKKILSRSRSSSLSCSQRISVYSHNTGEVPFIWEKQPGKPREASNHELLPPIRLPPAVHGLNMPKPRFHHSGPKAYLSKHIRKVKMIKNMQLRLPPVIRSLSMPRPRMRRNIYFRKSLSEKVKKIKNVHFRRKPKPKPKPAETDASGDNWDESYDSRSSNSYTSSPTTSDASDSSWSPSFSPFSFNPARKSRFWSLLPKKLVRKWRISKSGLAAH